MNIIKDLLSNDMFVCAIAAYVIAQFLKVFTHSVSERRWDPSVILSSGGMPSSHAATVCALTFRCAICYGVVSPLFAVCFVLAGVVMYDATGVRRAAGEQAKVLNRIISDLFSTNPEYSQNALKELVGHTPLQVAIGAIIGSLIGLFFPSLGYLFV